MDCVVRSQDLGYALTQCLNRVETAGEALRVGFVQVGGRVPVHDAVRQRHARATTGSHAHRIHTAAQKKSLRFGTLPQQEGSIWSEAFGAVQQHTHIGIRQAGQPVQRVVQHRFEVIPVLGQ